MIFFSANKRRIYKLLKTFSDSNLSTEERQKTKQEILNDKEIALPIIIQELKTLNSKFDWGILGFLLREMGDYAFDEVLKVSLSKDREISRRGNWALAGFHRTSVQKVIENLRHPSPRIRANMLFSINGTPEAKKVIPQVVELLGDNIQKVRQKALSLIQKHRKEAIEPLINARENGLYRLRKSALIALLTIAPEQLSERDKQLVKRLDDYAIKKQVPQFFFDNSWLVIPKTELSNILDWCELYEPEAASFSKGIDAVQCDFWHTQDDLKGASRTRVYITPVIDDKWIFIVGGWFGITNENQEINATIEKFSKELGEAYCFTVQDRMGWYSWTIAKNGKIVRQHAGENSSVDIGELLPIEKRIITEMKANDEYIDMDSLSDWTPKIADYYTIYPEDIDENTPFEGVGYLAKTKYGLENGIPRRALGYWKGKI